MKQKNIRRPRITDDVRRAIAELRYRYPDWTAERIRGALRPLTGITPPSIRAVYKLLQDIPPHTARFEEMEQLWHLGLLSKQEFRLRYPELSAEAIGHILEAQKAARDFFERRPHPSGRAPVYIAMSVRTALWVARLHEAVRVFWAPDDKFQYHLVLYCVSMYYGRFELICELSHTNFDTSELDEALRNREPSFFEDARRMLYAFQADSPIARQSIPGWMGKEETNERDNIKKVQE